MAQYKCTNFGNCEKADNREIIEASGLNPRCPEFECGSTLTAIPSSSFGKSWIGISASILLLGVLGFIAYYYWSPKTPNYQYILKLHGSNTIGEKLAPILAKSYLIKLGGKNAKEELIEEKKKIISAEFNGISRAIEIHALGSKTAFTDLADKKCDIGMSSMQISDYDTETLKKSGLGDMRSRESEHVIALDGIAIIVNRNNPLTELTLEDIKQIFMGKITSWDEVSGYTGRKGTIHLYARDANSGTLEFFKMAVLGKDEKLGQLTKDFVKNQELDIEVANDEMGISFISMTAVKDAKIIKVKATKSNSPILPTPFTVAQESYRLHRHLYFYTSAESYLGNYNVKDFIQYIQSDEGQQVVNQAGFVDQKIKFGDVSTTPENLPVDDPRARLIQGARPVNVSLHFLSGHAETNELNPKAAEDINRIIRETKKEGNLKEIILIGYTDSDGDDVSNQKLSAQRAEFVSHLLQENGSDARVLLRPTGLGERYTIAENESEQGKKLNRRVEVWIK